MILLHYGGGYALSPLFTGISDNSKISNKELERMKKLRGGWTQSTFTHWTAAKIQHAFLRHPATGKNASSGHCYLAGWTKSTFTFRMPVATQHAPFRHQVSFEIPQGNNARLSRTFTLRDDDLTGDVKSHSHLIK